MGGLEENVLSIAEPPPTGEVTRRLVRVEPAGQHAELALDRGETRARTDLQQAARSRQPRGGGGAADGSSVRACHGVTA
eukprot:7410426-Pyramimonas_sp.AAC.1